MKASMKAKNAVKLSTLRMLIAAIANKEIELRKKDIGLSDEEVLEVIKSESKKRKDSISEFQKGQRPDLVERESKELEFLLEYLPPEIPDDEISRVIGEAMRETGAKGPQDFGQAMKVVMSVLKGRASGDRISKMLREKLGSQ